MGNEWEVKKERKMEKKLNHFLWFQSNSRDLSVISSSSAIWSIQLCNFNSLKMFGFPFKSLATNVLDESSQKFEKLKPNVLYIHNYTYKIYVSEFMSHSLRIVSIKLSLLPLDCASTPHLFILKRKG